MVRRYSESIDVRTDAPADDVTSPAAFLWRGRLYRVGAVLGHWRERQAWWREAVTSPEALADTERHVWRVEASPGRVYGTGVYDLARVTHSAEGSQVWSLLRVSD